MPSYTNAWVPFGILSPFLLAVGAIVCSEKATGLKPIPSNIRQPTDCLMECTRMTYIKRLQLGDNRNIRLMDSTEGRLGEYCWSTELKCTVGESFHSAFVVLPTDISAVGHEHLEVKSTDLTAGTLDIHTSPSTIADGCGFRYDVTPHFGSQAAGTSFCVLVATREDALGGKLLKCPPYLVTFWQTMQATQQDGG